MKIIQKEIQVKIIFNKIAAAETQTLKIFNPIKSKINNNKIKTIYWTWMRRKL